MKLVGEYQTAATRFDEPGTCRRGGRWRWWSRCRSTGPMGVTVSSAGRLDGPETMS